MLITKKNIYHITSVNNVIHCQACSIRKLCISFKLNEQDIELLDNIIERRKPIQKGQILFSANDEFKYLYAIRSGSIKSYLVTEQGDEQIIAFHLSGDLVGFDAIVHHKHNGFAQALETSMICQIPFENLDLLLGKLPRLRKQVMCLMSEEIKFDQDLIQLLSKKNAEKRLASFICDLSFRFAQRGFSSVEFRLSMTRNDIANYLGLTVETISRFFGKLQNMNVIKVKGKYIYIKNIEKLKELARY